MSKKLYVIVSYLLVYIIWSTTYLAVKLGVHSIPLFLFLGLRWFFSGLFIAFIGLLVYKKNYFHGITKKQLMNSILIGFFILVLNQSLFTESMKTLDSYLAAIITATTPLVMTIFDYFINGIKFSKSTAFAILLGIIGIGVLLFPGSSKISFDFHIITLLIGIVAFALGSALSHKIELPKNSLANSTIQMVFAGIAGFIFFMIQGNNLAKETSGISQNSMISLIYLIIFGSIGMVAYIYIVKHEPLSRVSTYAFVNPIGATFLGLFFGEVLTGNFFVAAPMILVALLIMLRSRESVEHAEAEGER